MEPIVQEVELAWPSAGSLLNGRAEKSGSNPRKARAQPSVSRFPRLRTNQAHFRHRCFLPSNACLVEIGTHSARIALRRRAWQKLRAKSGSGSCNSWLHAIASALPRAGHLYKGDKLI